MHSRYRSPILEQLRDQQVRFAPRDKKLEQVNRAERLLSISVTFLAKLTF